MPQITDLEVSCEKSGMTVELSFSSPFNGLIFSKGHFSNPACRYLESGQAVTQFSFSIPMSECGTLVLEGLNGTDGFTNTIVMQMDSEVQEVWDSARKINCEWTKIVNKQVKFAPF